MISKTIENLMEEYKTIIQSCGIVLSDFDNYYNLSIEDALQELSDLEQQFFNLKNYFEQCATT